MQLGMMINDTVWSPWLFLRLRLMSTVDQFRGEHNRTPCAHQTRSRYRTRSAQNFVRRTGWSSCNYPDCSFTLADLANVVCRCTRDCLRNAKLSDTFTQCGILSSIGISCSHSLHRRSFSQCLARMRIWIAILNWCYDILQDCESSRYRRAHLNASRVWLTFGRTWSADWRCGKRLQLFCRK